MSDEAENAALAFLLKLDSATQRELLRRFEEVLQTELDTDSARRRRIALALHQTSRMVGRSPSIREYKRLREEHPERGWPHPRSLTRWLGVRSWNDVLVRMGLEPVLDGDTIEGAIGPSYAVDEVIQAVRDCASDLGRPPTITEYLAWQHRPDVRERPGRRPAGTWVFNRIFGGFPQARVAAGLVEGEPTAAHPSELLLRSANYRLDDEQILADIRDVAARTAGHLTATVYDRERRLICQETRAAGRPRALAGVGTIYRHFGSWTTALKAAALDTERTTPDHPSTRQRLKQFTDGQLLEALRQASKETQELLTVERYCRWRSHQVAADRSRSRLLASPTTFYRRFGNWPAALAAAGVDAQAPSERRGHGPFSNELLLHALAEAETAATGRLTIAAYQTWRSRQLRLDPRRPIPHRATIIERFGSWSLALEQMRDWRRKQ